MKQQLKEYVARMVGDLPKDVLKLIDFSDIKSHFRDKHSFEYLFACLHRLCMRVIINVQIDEQAA